MQGKESLVKLIKDTLEGWLNENTGDTLADVLEASSTLGAYKQKRVAIIQGLCMLGFQHLTIAEILGIDIKIVHSATTLNDPLVSVFAMDIYVYVARYLAKFFASKYNEIQQTRFMSEQIYELLKNDLKRVPEAEFYYSTYKKREYEMQAAGIYNYYIKRLREKVATYTRKVHDYEETGDTDNILEV